MNTDVELDDYTYRVAGCVGEFWTKMCRAHLFYDAPLDDEFLVANGVRFGKGLQLVNILRDLPRDLRQGRCYLPGDRLWAIGLTPLDLLEPVSGRKLRPLYDAYLEQAEEHLAAGWIYTNALPRKDARVRLACAWPLLIGIRTVEKLRANNLLAPELHVKISRSEVRQTCLWLTTQSFIRVLSHPSRLTAEGIACASSGEAPLTLTVGSPLLQHRGGVLPGESHPVLEEPRRRAGHVRPGDRLRDRRAWNREILDMLARACLRVGLPEDESERLPAVVRTAKALERVKSSLAEAA